MRGWPPKIKVAGRDLAILGGLLLLPLLFFWPVTLGGKTLLPLDNLFLSQPWKSFAAEYGVSIPHNGLLSDLVLENYVWKRFILETLRAGQLPLWNPYLFAGVPFLAAGQHSALYPLSVLFYVLPLPQAYGWFTALQFFLTAAFTFFFCRVIGLGRFGAVIAAITYTFSLFMVAQVVFPMIIAAASWLPLLLAAIELVVRSQEGEARRSPVPHVAWGAVALGCEWLAGHVEVTYFVLIVMALYAGWRLAGLGVRVRAASGGRAAVIRALKTGLWLAFMVLLGCGLASIQIVPLYELVRTSFRQGAVTLQQVLGWAYPKRHVLAFLMPDFFGNPSHHSYFDLFSRTVVPVTRNYMGAAITTTEWGIKNYVEGACYVGILPLLLALMAVIGEGRRAQRSDSSPSVARRTHVWFFFALALFSLALAFGTPLYALIYHLPGLSQSHSPFRWILPYTFSVSVLAGVGAQRLTRSLERGSAKLQLSLAWAALGIGVALLMCLGLSLPFAERASALAERVMLSLAKAPEAFADGRVFYSYQFRNAALLGILLAASGGVLLLSLARVRQPRLWGLPLWGGLALLLIIADLFFFGYRFNPSADPDILNFVPPVIEFLKKDTELYRITVYDTRSTKPLPANEGMFFDLYDIRGYDSIIPKRYADLMGVIEEQSELLYNRIARLRHPESLTSPLLDLLNVKYVLSEEEIKQPGYTLVYDGELKVYRNEDYLPRAFLVYRAEVMSTDEELFAALRRFDPRQVALFEEPVPALGPLPSGWEGAAPTIVRYTPNEVEIEASLPVTGALVLADSHFPDWSRAFQGWKAYDTPAGQAEERELRIYRVDGNLRGVILPPGGHHVRMRYTPMSLKFGLFVSFLSGTALVLLVALWAWRRYYSEEAASSPWKRVAKNTGSLVLLNLLNRTLDMVFAMFMLRVLGPADAGKYTFAIVVVTWFEIVTNFGLNTLLTREVARDQAHGNRYLSNTSALRLALCGLALPVVFAFLALGKTAFDLTADTSLAIVLLTIGLIPSGISTGLSAVFNAHEKMEYPAAISTLTTLLGVIGRTLVLLLGWGIVGLAGVSIVVNLITLGVLFEGVRRHFFQPRWEPDWRLQKAMLAEAWPLMLNHLLATLFMKVDVTLLKAMMGDRIVGYYGTAYKPVDALLIIPSYFTLAVFPMMSRYAASARDSLRQAYHLSLKFLLLLALPLMIAVFFAAEPIIALLGGTAYLPESRIALQLLIGFLPFSFINGITQYILIALGQQRFLTRAFLIGLGFNLLANLLLIPRFGYQASALIHIFSELALLIPFYWGVRRHLGAIPWVRLAWRPLIAAGAMGALMFFWREQSLLWMLPLGLACYIGLLLVLGVFGQEERSWLRTWREGS